MPRALRSTAFAVTALLTALLAGGVASAQQLVDASEKGDVAFDVFAAMCILFVGLLFVIDHVRKRGS